MSKCVKSVNEADAFLRSKGWRPTSSTPGSFWLWELEHEGRRILVDKITALAMQSAVDGCPGPDAPARAASITAEFLWSVHRAALGGVSSVSGAPLPEKIEDCPPGAQGAHWGLALAVAAWHSENEPPAPAAVSRDEQRRIRASVHALIYPEREPLREPLRDVTGCDV